MKNNLVDLHNIMMEQLQRLNEAESGDEIQQETARAKEMSNVARNIVDNAKVMLEAQKVYAESSGALINPNGTIFQIENK